MPTEANRLTFVYRFSQALISLLAKVWGTGLFQVGMGGASGSSLQHAGTHLSVWHNEAFETRWRVLFYLMCSDRDKCAVVVLQLCISVCTIQRVKRVFTAEKLQKNMRKKLFFKVKNKHLAFRCQCRVFKLLLMWLLSMSTLRMITRTSCFMPWDFLCRPCMLSYDLECLSLSHSYTQTRTHPCTHSEVCLTWLFVSLVVSRT